MRLRYPKFTFVFIAIIVMSIVALGLALEYRERQTWPPSVPNPGQCVIADSQGNTQARADQLVLAIEQFEKVNHAPPGALRQLKPTYINTILLPVEPVEPWTYTRGALGSWKLYFKDPDHITSWTDHTYTSESRSWQTHEDGF